MSSSHPISRRSLLVSGALATAGLALPRAGWGARAPRPTAPGIEGPFYPPEWPRVPADFTGLDDDADLLWVAGQSGFAAGDVLELEGRVLDASGAPLPNVGVDIWQCDANGRYHHPGDTNPVGADLRFQGFGRTITDGAGAYRFRAIRPVPYPGRTPHIHFKLKDATTADLLTTQMYVAGDPGNADDALYQAVPADRRGTVTIRLRNRRRIRLAGERRRVRRGRFDLVLGVTATSA